MVFLKYETLANTFGRSCCIGIPLIVPKVQNTLAEEPTQEEQIQCQTKFSTPKHGFIQHNSGCAKMMGRLIADT